MAESGVELMATMATAYTPGIEYLVRIPGEVAAAVKPLVDKWAWLTPPWCQRLQISWDGAGCDDGRIMDCSISYRYRRVKIIFYGGFLDVPPEEREQCFVHELLHGFVGVLAEFAEELVDRLIPETEAPKFRETCRMELDARHEAVVQDLAFRIYRQFEWQ